MKKVRNRSLKAFELQTQLRTFGASATKSATFNALNDIFMLHLIRIVAMRNEGFFYLAVLGSSPDSASFGVFDQICHQ